MQVVSGITAKEHMAVNSWDRVSELALGLASKRLSPSSVPVHWNSWEGTEVYSMPEPKQKTSQCLVKMLHSSIVTPTLTLGRSSFGPQVAVGAGAVSMTIGAGSQWGRS